MNEIQAILAAFAQCQQNSTPAVLASIVNTQGSTYRRAGARMLIKNTQEIVGTISGGCLEKDVLEYAQQVLQSGKPTVVTYDTTADEDIVWGLGLGCNGVVQVLIERLESNSELNPLTFINRCFQRKQQGAIATVFRVTGNINISVGARLLLDADGTVISDIGEPILSAILSDAQAVKQAQSVKTYTLSTGSVEVRIEIIQPPTPLIIFGAGNDAIPIAQFAKALGWDVTIVDLRATKTIFTRFANADHVILARPETVHAQINLSDRTVAVIITHNYLHDRELLKWLIPSPVCYLGILGSKRRSEKLLQELRAAGNLYTPAQLAHLYAPVGLDIGAETPEEIAIAIIAEIQAILTNHPGGFLKNRPGAIHQGQSTALP